EQSALAIASDTDRRMILFLAEPINSTKDLLHLVADNVPAHLERHAINELTVRLISETAQLRAARPGVLAVDQRRDDNMNPACRQYCDCLRGIRVALQQPSKPLRRLVRVRNCYNAGP